MRTVRLGTGEELPLLVGRASGVPPVLPLRWVTRYRRLSASGNTLKADLRGVADLYEWGHKAFAGGLEGFLAAGGRLSAPQLDSLMDFVRSRTYRRGKDERVRDIATAGLRIGAIETFLRWAADPLNRGGQVYIPESELLHYRERLRETFEPFRHSGSESVRPEPLTEVQDELLRDLIFPIRGAGGKVTLPVRFPRQNPFKPESQVRNWLIYLLLRELGLRRGEALKIALDDLPKLEHDFLLIRRRPDDPADTRADRPQVKGIEAPVPATAVIQLALRVYLTDLRHPGRRKKGSPYLLTSASGRPMSVGALEGVWRTIRRRHASAFPSLGSHALRHTWAEEVAQDLIVGRQQPKENALAILREAGRWKPSSTTPLHYIQNALRAEAHNLLRARHHALYGNPLDDEWQ